MGVHAIFEDQTFCYYESAGVLDQVTAIQTTVLWVAFVYSCYANLGLVSFIWLYYGWSCFLVFHNQKGTFNPVCCLYLMSF